MNQCSLPILLLDTCYIGMAMCWTFDLELESGKMRQNFDKELALVSSQNEQFSYICFFIVVICASVLAVT